MRTEDLRLIAMVAMLGFIIVWFIGMVAILSGDFAAVYLLSAFEGVLLFIAATFGVAGARNEQNEKEKKADNDR